MYHMFFSQIPSHKSPRIGKLKLPARETTHYEQKWWGFISSLALWSAIT